MSEESISKLKALLRRLSRPQVLVVEDSIDDAFLTGRTLRNIGIESKVVGTAEEAIAELRAGAYQLCFLDLKLPDSSNPIELVARIQGAQPTVQICILTGNAIRDGDERQKLEKQVLSIICKPLDAMDEGGLG